MVALDEAFAGIDDKFKPELLGLTVKFDLDLFTTGHDLWVKLTDRAEDSAIRHAARQG